ncbi:uncharacterized protein VP01_4494g1 [Puccinia sorghi]|uniref:Uncharacterized protein n=1 Tax=Puccinia sorghi TaxID=27349 RepID=A0A0L6UR66_9BASI|nr:uncharacterized protein VP01_4494g1 [Puccinia sorghi]
MFWHSHCAVRTVTVQVRKKENNKCKGNPWDKSKGGKTWYYQTNYPHHNHPATKDPESHVETHRLSPAEYTKLKNLNQASLKPGKILLLIQFSATDIYPINFVEYVEKNWISLAPLFSNPSFLPFYFFWDLKPLNYSAEDKAQEQINSIKNSLEKMNPSQREIHLNSID